ncbi:TPA: hypothetical protein RFV54_003714 [Klebsiella aerogenes]|nr:hypothetical protein [Klebsiella aerogenes]
MIQIKDLNIETVKTSNTYFYRVELQQDSTTKIIKTFDTVIGLADYISEISKPKTLVDCTHFTKLCEDTFKKDKKQSLNEKMNHTIVELPNFVLGALQFEKINKALTQEEHLKYITQ